MPQTLMRRAMRMLRREDDEVGVPADSPETKKVAPDVTGAPIEQTGQAPNVSKKMGPEMESAQRASPDEQ